MADDPFAREIGRLEDEQGRVIVAGVSYGGVTLRTLRTRTSGAVELRLVPAEEFRPAVRVRVLGGGQGRRAAAGDLRHGRAGG